MESLEPAFRRLMVKTADVTQVHGGKQVRNEFVDETAMKMRISTAAGMKRLFQSPDTASVAALIADCH